MTLYLPWKYCARARQGLRSRSVPWVPMHRPQRRERLIRSRWKRTLRTHPLPRPPGTRRPQRQAYRFSKRLVRAAPQLPHRRPGLPSRRLRQQIRHLNLRRPRVPQRQVRRPHQHLRAQQQRSRGPRRPLKLRQHRRKRLQPPEPQVPRQPHRLQPIRPTPAPNPPARKRRGCTS